MCVNVLWKYKKRIVKAEKNGQNQFVLEKNGWGGDFSDGELINLILNYNILFKSIEFTIYNK